MLFLIVSSICSTIAVFLACFVFTGQISLSFFLLIATILMLGCVSVRIIVECRQYGKENVFRFLKKRDAEATKRDIFIQGLESQNHNKVLVSKQNENLLVCLNQNGVHLFYIIESSGMIFERDSKWYQKDGSDEFEISNPFQYLKEEENRLHRLLEIPIHSSIVIDSATAFQKLDQSYPIFRFSNAHYFLSKVDMKEKYTEEDFLKIEDKIKDNYC